MKMRPRGDAACSKDNQRLALKLADALKLLYDTIRRYYGESYGSLPHRSSLLPTQEARCCAVEGMIK